MGYRVGSKGQIVIEKEIRDRLGVRPGWIASQRLVGDHVEIYFISPEHNDSLAGILAPHTSVTISDSEFDRAREQAWQAHAQERFGRPVRDDEFR